MMNKLAIICAALCACAAVAEITTEGTNVVFTTTLEDGSANPWTGNDLRDALGLVNRMYHRDVQTASGRVKWHGRLTREIVDTNACMKVEVYSDGARFTNAFRRVSATERNRRLKTTVNARGIPTRLAEARQRRADEKATTNIVTVTISP